MYTIPVVHVRRALRLKLVEARPQHLGPPLAVFFESEKPYETPPDIFLSVTERGRAALAAHDLLRAKE